MWLWWEGFNESQKAMASKKNLSNPGQLVLDLVFIMFQVIAISSFPTHHPPLCKNMHVGSAIEQCCAVAVTPSLSSTLAWGSCCLILVAKFWTPVPKPLVLTKGQDCLFFDQSNKDYTASRIQERRSMSKKEKKAAPFSALKYFSRLVHLFLLLSLAARYLFFR